MKQIAAVVVLVLGCGGGGTRAPATVGNETESTAPPPAAAAGSEAFVFSQTQGGGVIELRGDHDLARDDANRKMTAHCGPDNFQVYQEGTEIIGADGGVDVRAWRVHYSCAGP
jgi:hypothetical protein